MLLSKQVRWNSNVFDYFNTRSLHCGLKFPGNFTLKQPHRCSKVIISMKPQLGIPWEEEQCTQQQRVATSTRRFSATGVPFTGAIRSSRHRAFARSFMIPGMHSKGASHHGSNKLLNAVTHLTATFAAFREESSLQWATLIRCIFRGILFGQKAIDTFKPVRTEACPNAD